MEYWEFLLQKEGDLTWQPLDPPKMELEADRYRVVAHSSRTNTDVDVCVTHESTEEVPPMRRSQKRSRRTNPEGLMVVIPFTYLKPGRWEFRCCGDVMSDFMGKSWQHSVELQVVPKTVEVLPTDEAPSTVAETPQNEIQVEVSEPLPSNLDSELAAELARIEAATLPAISRSEHEEVSANGNLGLDGCELHTLRKDENLSASISTSQSAAPSSEPETNLSRDRAIASNGNGFDEAKKSTGDFPVSSLPQIPNHQPPVPSSEPKTNPSRDRAIASNGNGLDDAEKFAGDFPVSPLPQIPNHQSPVPNHQSPSPSSEPETNPSRDRAIASNGNGLNNAEEFAGDFPDSPHPQVPNPQSLVPNPILEHSLQMLEQVLQQVLDPVLEDFEQPEPTDSVNLETPDPELADLTDSDRQRFSLTLDNEAFVARRGEALTVTGRVNVLDVERSRSETDGAANDLFQGTLRYELREPQTSQVLLDVRQPLPEQGLPLTFSHNLEIPPDCHTRLFLGKVTLYGSTSAPLASQPFSVTADLDELIGAIIPETRTMPMAKMLVLTEELGVSQKQQLKLTGEDSPSSDRAVLELIDTSGNHPLPLQPASNKPLPPQIYQPPVERPSKKSLQLPALPNMRVIVPTGESFPLNGSKPERVEVNPEKTVEQSLSLLNGFSTETPESQPADKVELIAAESQLQKVADEFEEAAVGEDTATATDSVAWDAIAPSELPIPIADSELNRSDVTETPDLRDLTASSDSATLIDAIQMRDRSESTADEEAFIPEASDVLTPATPEVDGLFEDWDAADWQEATASEVPVIESVVDERSAEDWDAADWEEATAAEVPVTESVADERSAIDNAFHSLNLQERFWLRLNSLAADNQLTQWLKSESSPSNVVEVEEVSPPPSPEPGVAEVEDVTEQLNSDTLLDEFDESMWAEEGEQLSDLPSGDSLAASHIAVPPLEENAFPSEETPEQQDLEDSSEADWASQEFVVDDDEEPVSEKPMDRGNRLGRVEPAMRLAPQTQPEIHASPPLELPLPAPTLLIPASELTAGEMAIVRVQLPPHPTLLCVKLWVQDRQTRSLLDEPHWLMDLIPDARGEQEALTQIVVPYGSAEIRFEAIAVDLDTQRESHKVAVDRVVVPPNLPEFSLDEFET